jgi:hypothetical protein
MTTRRRLIMGWAVLAAWVIAVLIWATLPATDHVPTGVVDGVNTSIVVECGAPFDRSAGPAEPIPPVEPPRALQHIPCEAQHRSNQIALVIDGIVALAAAAVLVTVTRRRRSPTTESTAPPERASV